MARTSPPQTAATPPERRSTPDASAAVAAPQAGGRAALRGGLAGWQVRRLILLAAGSLGDLSVAAMAAAVRLSPSHFSRAFRVTFGVPPRTWLSRQRMQVAGERLRGTSDTVERIAVELGYKTSSQFCRAFRAEFGRSPRAFRRS